MSITDKYPVNIFHLCHPFVIYPPKYPLRQLALLFGAITAPVVWIILWKLHYTFLSWRKMFNFWWSLNANYAAGSLRIFLLCPQVMSAHPSLCFPASIMQRNLWTFSGERIKDPFFYVAVKWGGVAASATVKNSDCFAPYPVATFHMFLGFIGAWSLKVTLNS